MILYSSHGLLQLGDFCFFIASGNITMEWGESQARGFQVVTSSTVHSLLASIRCWSEWVVAWFKWPLAGLTISCNTLESQDYGYIERETHSASCLMLLSHRLLRKSLGAIPSNLEGIHVLSCSEFRAWEISEPCNYALHLTEASVKKEGIQMLQDC